MGSLPADPVLADAARRLEGINWAALILDAQMRLVWISDEFMGFLGTYDEEELGYGENVIAAFIRERWRERLTVDSQVRIFNDLMPYFMYLSGPDRSMFENLPEPFAGLVASVEPKEPPPVVETWFDYSRPGQPGYRVNLVASPLSRLDGGFLGFWAITYMDVRPQLVSLLAQGDEAMYERMANLVEPRRRPAAILSAEIESSGTLSKLLPSAGYFSVIWRVTTAIDEVIADHEGIVAQHAGAGVSALFLAEDLGSASRAAAAAVEAAKAIRNAGDFGIQEVVRELGAPEQPAFAMNVGLHWGATLFMGQLVPGGRLDVTALGDEMNECARMGESARDGVILATKALLEQLDEVDARKIRIDPDAQLYCPLAEWETATDRAKEEAGRLAITEVT